MRILISNDDGMISKGLETLVNFAKTISDDVWVIVPSLERSGGGHGITIFDPLKIKKIELDQFSHDKTFTISGTPADCVIIALHYLLKDKKPDIMFSGINIGENLGEDIIYSGTVAAAREAALHGIKSIAFSQSYDSLHHIDYEVAGQYLLNIYEKIKDYNFTNSLYNVNFPAVREYNEVKDIIVVPLGKKLHIDLITTKVNNGNRNDEEFFWVRTIREKNKIIEVKDIKTDIDGIANNFITVTPVSLNLTNFCDLDVCLL